MQTDQQWTSGANDGKRYVPWPLEGYNPEHVLGGSLEAFDPIRMDCSCYIALARYPGCPDFAVVKIMGDDEHEIANAEKRVVNTYLQVQSRDFPELHWFLVKPSNPSATRTHVRLHPYPGPSSVTGNKAPKDVGMTPKYEGSQFTQSTLWKRRYSIDETDLEAILAEGPHVERRNLLMVEAVTLSTLQLLTHYRGNLQMRARLGTFVMTKYRRPENGQFPLQQFEDLFTEHNTEEGQTEAHVTKE